MNLLDTIAAVSTPYGKGGIAVLRISGHSAVEIAGLVFEPVGKKLCEIEHSKAVYGKIYYGTCENRVQIDDGIAVCFKAPNSFTGEDVVEISCHGGILITQKVLEALLLAGARVATAGEFTRRAFVNGKMKLTSAEAVGTLLEAKTQEQLTLAGAGMRGVLSKETDEIYNALGDILAAIFAKIDYPDEDLADLTNSEMKTLVDKNIKKLDKLLQTYKTGHAVNEGVSTVLVGRTNAGKSSLYNRILGRDAAIVTHIEGTTRDVLSEGSMLGRVLIKLSDTAGLRDVEECSDIVEQIGIERTKKELENSELLLVVFDGTRELDEQDMEILKLVEEHRGVCVAVINKSDLDLAIDKTEIEKHFKYTVQISANTGHGYDDLVKLVENLYINEKLDTSKDAIISNARQNNAVLTCKTSLCNAYEYINQDMPLEICCAEIERAMQNIGELDGRVVSEDVVAKIFSSFCVGK